MNLTNLQYSMSRKWSKQSAHGCLRPRVLGFGPLHLHCAILWHMTSEEGLGEMFEGDYADFNQILSAFIIFIIYYLMYD